MYKKKGSLCAVLTLAVLLFPQVLPAQNYQALLERFNVVVVDGRRMVEVTLRDALELALQRSNLLKAARIGEEIARSNLVSAQESLNPTLTNTVSYGRGISPSSWGENFVDVSRSDTLTLSSEFSKSLPNGVEYAVEVSESSTSGSSMGIASAGDTPAAGSSYGPRTGTAVKGSVNIPLFQDYGRELGDIPVRLGEVGVRRGRHANSKEANTVLRNIALTYWALVEVLENVRVQKEAVALSGRLFADNQERLKAGVLSPADVKISEAQLARDNQALLAFQLDALRIEDLTRAALNLEKMELGLLPVDKPKVRPIDFKLEELQARLFKRHPDLGLLDTSLQTNNFEMVAVQNGEEINLDLSLYYIINGYGDSTFGGISGLSQTDLDSYGAAITWTVPLFDHVTEEQIRRKKMERVQLDLRKKELKASLTVRLQSSLRLLRLAVKEVETAKVLVSLAGDLLQNEIERFKLGRSTSYRIAQFQQDKAVAGRREILARVRFERSFLEMLILTGDVYSFYRLPSTYQSSSPKQP